MAGLIVNEMMTTGPYKRVTGIVSHNCLRFLAGKEVENNDTMEQPVLLSYWNQGGDGEVH